MPFTPNPCRKPWSVTLELSKWIIFCLSVTEFSLVARVLMPNGVSGSQSYLPINGSDTSSHARDNSGLLEHDLVNKHEAYVHLRRQAAAVTTTETPTSANPDQGSGDVSLIDLPEPIFFPEVVATFQLALKSNSSIVAVIGGDNNIYLSNQANSGVTASTFSLLDLGLSNKSYVALIQDAQTQRYLHVYKDIRDNQYSRVRTNLESHLPCSTTVMFWTFVKGYLQFFRGGQWFYDTVGCLDPATNLVKIWVVNGQQGLTALQAKQGECGLAPLVGINFS